MKKLFAYALVMSALLAVCVMPASAQKVKTAEEVRNRLQIAEEIFRERCKTAGEKIFKNVDNVNSIFLVKLRPKKVNFSDQFTLDDPYGSDTGGDGYIENFLRGRPFSGSITHKQITRNGYQYIETIDPKDGKRYRYTGSVKVVGRMDAFAPNVQVDLKRNPNFDLNIYAYVLDRVPATGPMPRYGVTYDDISTREEREYWIAGSSLKIIDLQTNEVMAERIGYMMDRGQGNTSGGRSPWLLAANNACPSFPSGDGRHPVQIHQTRNFVEKVLQIKQGK